MEIYMRFCCILSNKYVCKNGVIQLRQAYITFRTKSRTPFDQDFAAETI